MRHCPRAATPCSRDLAASRPQETSLSALGGPAAQFSPLAPLPLLPPPPDLRGRLPLAGNGARTRTDHAEVCIASYQCPEAVDLGAARGLAVAANGRKFNDTGLRGDG